MAKIAAHGTVGGLSSVANGGRFESGFLSSGLSELAGQNNLYGRAKGNGWQIASGAARAAIVGGTVSELSGGSFESGALNAALGRLFNGVAHAMRAYITTGFTVGGAAVGAVLGGLGGGAAAGVVSGGTLAIPGAGYGAAQGAAYGSAIGYVAANVTLIAADALDNIILNIDSVEPNLEGHAEDRAKERNVSPEAIDDALKNPIKTKPVRVDSHGRPSQQLVGKEATVVVNPETGKIITVWRTSSKRR
jgi:hypothetical protein